MGTGTARADWETGDPGYHPRCRFFGGPEMNMLAENQKESQLCLSNGEERKSIKCSKDLSFDLLGGLSYSPMGNGRVRKSYTNKCNHIICSLQLETVYFTQFY